MKRFVAQTVPTARAGARVSRERGELAVRDDLAPRNCAQRVGDVALERRAHDEVERHVLERDVLAGEESADAGREDARVERRHVRLGDLS